MIIMIKEYIDCLAHTHFQVWIEIKFYLCSSNWLLIIFLFELIINYIYVCIREPIAYIVLVIAFVTT